MLNRQFRNFSKGMIPVLLAAAALTLPVDRSGIRRAAVRRASAPRTAIRSARGSETAPEPLPDSAPASDAHRGTSTLTSRLAPFAKPIDQGAGDQVIRDHYVRCARVI
jgi:hypothetical protein